MRYGLQNIAITLAAIVLLYWLVGLYDAALRDPRYLDGWVLCAGIAAQFFFHLRKKSAALSVGPAESWLSAHIFIGYFVIAAFLSHISFSTPDFLLEWILWLLFLLVATSGVVGAYLTWAIPTKLERRTEPIAFERIPAFQSMLAKQAGALAIDSVNHAGSMAISELYSGQLHAFFHQPRNLFSHLRGSKRPLRRLCDEIDSVDQYVDESGRKLLSEIREFVIEKDALDSHYAHQGALQIWLFIHIPATYCMIVFTLLHVAAVYAYSSAVP